MCLHKAALENSHSVTVTRKCIFLGGGAFNHFETQYLISAVGLLSQQHHQNPHSHSFRIPALPSQLLWLAVLCIAPTGCSVFDVALLQHGWRGQT